MNNYPTKKTALRFACQARKKTTKSFDVKQIRDRKEINLIL